MGTELVSPKVDEFMITTKSGWIYYKVHKVDEFTAKFTKWTNLLLSPQSGRVYY